MEKENKPVLQFTAFTSKVDIFKLDGYSYRKQLTLCNFHSLAPVAQFNSKLFNEFFFIIEN